jgi:hypothetical protein
MVLGGAKCNGRHANLVNEIKDPNTNAPSTNQEVGSSNLSGRAPNTRPIPDTRVTPAGSSTTRRVRQPGYCRADAFCPRASSSALEPDCFAKSIAVVMKRKELKVYQLIAVSKELAPVQTQIDALGEAGANRPVPRFTQGLKSVHACFVAGAASQRLRMRHFVTR